MAHGARVMEKIIAAAVLVNGRIFSGFTHADARDAMCEALPFGSIPDKYPHGFVTTTGRFLTRDEALELARTSNPDAAQRAEESADAFRKGLRERAIVATVRTHLIAEHFTFSRRSKYT
jgi:hypothetical protein